jgi:DNA mismatch repair protein MutS
LAGLPRSVIERAREVLRKHEQNEHELSETLSPGASGDAHHNGHQEVLFTALDRDVLQQLRGADLDQLKPLEALNLLAELKKQIS